MDNLILYALIKKYINDQLSKIDPTIPSEYITEDELAAELAKLSFPAGTYLFKTSSISSTFAGPNGALDAENLVDPELGPNIKVGDLAIFPDDKSNVLYLGTISEIDEYPSLVVSNIIYLKDNWIFTGDWHQGMVSSYPEVYRFEGGLWLCLGSSITNPPHEESEQEVKEWKLLAASGNGEASGTTEIPDITFTATDWDADATTITNFFFSPQPHTSLIFSEGGAAKWETVIESAPAIVRATIEIPESQPSSIEVLFTRSSTAIDMYTMDIIPASILASLQDVISSGVDFSKLSMGLFMMYTGGLSCEIVKIARPMYVRTSEKPLEDKGGVGAEYDFSVDEITPDSIEPLKDDKVIFTTDKAAYIGKITAKTFHLLETTVYITAELKIADCGKEIDLSEFSQKTKIKYINSTKSDKYQADDTGKITITDADITLDSHIEMYPTDTATETYFSEHISSNILETDIGKFSLTLKDINSAQDIPELNFYYLISETKEEEEEPIHSSVIGFTGLTNAISTLTWTDDIAGLNSATKAYTTEDKGDYTEITGYLDNYFPYNKIHEVTDEYDNVFIAFPKCYIKWKRIETGELDGFQVASEIPEEDSEGWFIPDCFLDPRDETNSTYLEETWIGKYEGWQDEEGRFCSISGKAPKVDVTITDVQTACRKWGFDYNNYHGYQMYNMSQMVLYNFLCMLYYKTANIQTVCNGRTNESSAADTGSCDGVTGLNGWDTNTTCVKMLGVENPYGNIYKFVGGIYFYGKTIYADRNPVMKGTFSISDKETLDFTRPTAGGYIKYLKAGNTPETQSYVYASARGGSDSTYVGDNNGYRTDNTALACGGHWGEGAFAGLWCLSGEVKVSAFYGNFGGRLSRAPLD